MTNTSDDTEKEKYREMREFIRDNLSLEIRSKHASFCGGPSIQVSLRFAGEEPFCISSISLPHD